MVDSVNKAHGDSCEPSFLKMYILVLDDIDLGHAILSACHATAACMRSFAEDKDMNDWLVHSFRKVVCKVNQKEFDKAKSFDKNVVMTEMALNGKDTAIVFCPRYEWPKPFSWYKLYR